MSDEFPPFKHIQIKFIRNADLIEGYFDGRNDDEFELPIRLDNHSHSYKHGWLNGRDDRIGKSRDTAVNLRLQAEKAYADDNNH